MKLLRSASAFTLAVILSSCGGGGDSSGGTTPPVVVPPTPTPTPPPADVRPIVGLTQSTAVAALANPWAMVFMPDGRMLVSQRTATGALSIVTASGEVTQVTGLPTSIGLLDIKLAPDFELSRRIYFSYMVRDTTAPRVGRGSGDPALFPERMEVARATLNGTALSSVEVVFRQFPAITTFPGSGEPGGRIAFSPDARYVFITSGDRQELDATFLFSLNNNLGKIVRLNLDGSIPPDNPYLKYPGARGELWSLGHRNHYGLAFASDGVLWSSEMGPKGGDEFNIIAGEVNYGWPAVSDGNGYDGTPYPRDTPTDGYHPPIISWTPVIAPAGMVRYNGNEFFDWNNDFLLTGLQQRGIVRVRTNNNQAQEVQRIDLGARIRDIAVSPKGEIYVVTDGATGEIRKLTPVR